MIPRTALIHLGKMIAQDLAHGTVSDSLPAAGDLLASDPEGMLTVLDLVVREGARKKPNDGLLNAYGVLFGEGLQALRYGSSTTTRRHRPLSPRFASVYGHCRSRARCPPSCCWCC